MNESKLRTLAKDLTKGPPRSPRALLAGQVILARSVDKCRSVLLGLNGEYGFWPCSLCSEWESFTGIDHEALKDFVATGAGDDEIAEWVRANSKVQDPLEIIAWNNKMRYTPICDLPIEIQAYIENYANEYLPEGRPIYVWFDMYDLEEGRI